VVEKRRADQEVESLLVRTEDRDRTDPHADGEQKSESRYPDELIVVVLKYLRLIDQALGLKCCGDQIPYTSLEVRSAGVEPHRVREGREHMEHTQKCVRNFRGAAGCSGMIRREQNMQQRIHLIYFPVASPSNMSAIYR